MSFIKKNLKVITSYCFTFYSLFGFSQPFPDSYYNAISNVDSLIINQHYKAAALKYDSIFKSYEGKGTWFNRYVAAYLWNMAGNTDSAFYHLHDVANEKSYHTIGLALENEDFNNLKVDPRWSEFVVKVNNNKMYLQTVVPPGFTKLQKYGFDILISEFALQNYTSATDSALAMLDFDLARILRFRIKESAINYLKGIRIFLDWDTGYPNPQFHLSEDWLLQNGYIPEKAKQLDISNMRQYMILRNHNQPLIILHELAHAYHNNLSADKVKLIGEAYLNAIQKKLYQSVRYSHGNGTYDDNVKAYASNNEFEYFAEITTAYFGSCPYYPFNKRDLKRYDKTGYKLVKTIWLKK